ncbi:MAG: diguanylate cyclase [Lachnospiraceae bacterium]|nr:diguanylate cyclase [Lachnospiraceae bacterium]
MAVAVAFGPLPGAIVGLISGLCSGNFSGFSLFYLPVNILVGVMVGFLYPRKTKKEALGIVTLALLNGLISAFISTPVDVLVYQGDTGNLWGDALKDMLDTYVSVSNFNTLVAEVFIDFPDRIFSMALAQILLYICERERKNIRKKRAEKKKSSSKQAVSGRILFHVAVNNFTVTNPLVHYYLEGTGNPGVTCYQDEITPLSFTNLPYGKYKFHIEILNDMTGEVVRDEVIDVEKEAQMYENPIFLLYLSFVNSLILAYFIWLFIEIQRRNRRIRKLRREIQTDPMTGLLNKAGSHKSIGEACAKEKGILLMIDLDSFKLVNDLHGHEMGDRILIRLRNL